MNNKRYIIYSFLLGIFLIASSLPVVSANKPFTVVIDAGHGGKDPGAKGKTLKLMEKTINLNVALKIGEMIEKNYPDVKIIYTRKTDVFIELDQRAKIANKAKADLFISIHTNAAEARSARGTETYVLGLARSEEHLEVAKRENAAILYEDNYEEKYEGFDPNSTESYIIFEFIQNTYLDQSITVASDIQKEFAQTAKRSDRGVRQAGFLVLRKTSMPCVLVELGYISNPDEEKYLASVENQKTLATCIYKGFAKMKDAYDKKSQNPTPTPTPSTASESKKDSNEEAVNLPVTGAVVYKVQVFAADKKVSPNDKRLKKYDNASFYEEKGLYKYTIGESSSLDEINKIRKQLLPDFKDAFVVRFVNGVRQK